MTAKIDISGVIDVVIDENGLVQSSQLCVPCYFNDIKMYNIKNCTTVNCNTVDCTTINCTTINCTTIDCTTVRCSFLAHDTYDSYCQD